MKCKKKSKVKGLPVKKYGDLLTFTEPDFESFGMFKIWIFFELDNDTHNSTLRAIITRKNHADIIKKSLTEELEYRNKKYKTNLNLHVEENFANHPFAAEMFTPRALKYYYVKGRVIDGD